MLCCRMETSSFCALPAWPGVILREKGLKSASGDSTGGKALLAGPGREAGWWQREVLVLSRAAWGASSTSPSGFQSMWRNPWQRQSRSPHSPVKLDLFPGITCSTLKKIFTEFIFTSRSPSSQGALPCPPSLQLALHLPRASSRSPSPRPATIPAFVRGTMFTLHRGWGDWK